MCSLNDWLAFSQEKSLDSWRLETEEERHMNDSGEIEESDVSLKILFDDDRPGGQQRQLEIQLNGTLDVKEILGDLHKLGL